MFPAQIAILKSTGLTSVAGSCNKKGVKDETIYFHVLFVILCISFFHLFLGDARRSRFEVWRLPVNGAVELATSRISTAGNRYKETVHLMDVQLDFSLFGRNLNPGTGVVDTFSLTGRSIGDPFPAARLEVKKNKTYDFITSYNQYKYFSNREDNSFLTDNHDFNTKFSNFITGLSVFPKDDIKLNFNYRHWQKTEIQGSEAISSLRLSRKIWTRD
jgi:hypothetical protein